MFGNLRSLVVAKPGDGGASNPKISSSKCK